jgi:hypothetical protein
MSTQTRTAGPNYGKQTKDDAKIVAGYWDRAARDPLASPTGTEFCAFMRQRAALSQVQS